MDTDSLFAVGYQAFVGPRVDPCFRTRKPTTVILDRTKNRPTTGCSGRPAVRPAAELDRSLACTVRALCCVRTHSCFAVRAHSLSARTGWTSSRPPVLKMMPPQTRSCECRKVYRSTTDADHHHPILPASDGAHRRSLGRGSCSFGSDRPAPLEQCRQSNLRSPLRRTPAGVSF
jgi:hypothetical protein